MEIKNKLTITRRKEGGDNGGKKGKGCQEIYVKDPWTKTTGKRGGLDVGGRG